MRAVLYRGFKETPRIESLADPTPELDGVVIQVEATGICRSDWHGWMGHDPDIRLPHVPGHEFAGVVVAIGSRVRRWNVGDRVTVPFVCGCGSCAQCASGQQQICDRQFQPGFTHWGCFAEYVAIDYADANLVRLGDEMDFVTAASLGCRFATAFRAIVHQAKVSAGQWVAVHGCGGVGLSAVMIANALGANVIAIDIGDDKLDLARSVGAAETINASTTADVVSTVIQISQGGAAISVDALGSPTTCFNSIHCLRKQGKHIQVGLLLADDKHPSVPMDKVISHELEILGSHGMQAHRYPEMLAMIRSGKLQPEKLVTKMINLDESVRALTSLNSHLDIGVTVINDFG
ncbi:zinc-dependent alcohol dehydrogenase family protein [Stieleria sp. TO1_6]|uniref:zinc-dependent alcohol dehydrogenase family protein n=1 Tax=Stieleria tagensis TaxID=2956795 RepID=UPI00209AA6DF|nr:zinc-dependent alcohol dehydrogenase family protein [Stieleria tagensis]MCO8124125.1 zinc-dependent alcohol dehydrogenase family protein [Stieleria tagensis]